MRLPATLTRKAQTGQGSDGAVTYSTATVWSGNVYIETRSAKAVYEPTGVVQVLPTTAYLPYLTGSAYPIAGDILTAGGSTYLVESINGDSIHHHLEVVVRQVVRG